MCVTFQAPIYQRSDDEHLMHRPVDLLTMPRLTCVLLSLTLLPLLSACSTPEVTPAPTPPPVASVLPAEAYTHWLGRWLGPEGTYLELSLKDSNLQVLIRDLDGAAVYPAEAQSDGVVFVRAGRLERLHQGDGHATGMKWLLHKQDCLVIRSGDGYCRD
jgi:hypothetical protein